MFYSPKEVAPSVYTSRVYAHPLSHDEIGLNSSLTRINHNKINRILYTVQSTYVAAISTQRLVT